MRLATRILIALRQSRSLGMANEDNGVVLLDTEMILREMNSDRLQAFCYFLQIAAHEWSHTMKRNEPESEAEEFEEKFGEFLRKCLLAIQPEWAK